MNRILELQQKAQNLQEKHQSDIDEKLKSGMREIFNDTKTTLTEKAESLKKSIDSTKETLQNHYSEATAQVLSKIEQDTKALKKAQATATKELIQLQSEQIQVLQAHLQASSHLSQEIVNQANIKKTLITSTIALASVTAILLITTICLGYVSKSKWAEIQAQKERLQQIEATTQQKIQEFQTITTNLYKAKSKQ